MYNSNQRYKIKALSKGANGCLRDIYFVPEAVSYLQDNGEAGASVILSSGLTLPFTLTHEELFKKIYQHDPYDSRRAQHILDNIKKVTSAPARISRLKYPRFFPFDINTLDIDRMLSVATKARCDGSGAKLYS